MRIYIAGPITGIMDYREKFLAAEQRLRQKGHIVLNPGILPEGLKEYMRICFAMMDQAEAVYFLRGWKDSVGATQEFGYAKQLGLKMQFQDPAEAEW